MTTATETAKPGEAARPNPPAKPEGKRFRVRIMTRTSMVAGVVGLGLIAFLAALPFIVPDRGLIGDLFQVMVLLSLAQYWNLLAGYAGLVSVGQQAFVGLGGYALFGLTTGVFGVVIDPLTSIVIAGVISAIIAIPTAFLVFRLHGAYFAIGTWVVAEVFRLIIGQQQQFGGGTGTNLPTTATNGAAFVSFIREVMGETLDDGSVRLLRTAEARDYGTYWVVLVITVFTIGLVYWLLRSRRGLALTAIRDSEKAAGSVGVDSFRTKLIVFILAAFGTGLIGAIYFLQLGRVSPDAAFNLIQWTAYVIFIVVIGGIGTIEGPIVGTVVFYLLEDQLADFGTWYLMLLGGLAIVIMLFFPRGIWGTFADRFDIHLFPIRRRFYVIDRKDREP